ncbi:MAG: nucleoside deaminase [Sphingobacteriales bacterium]|jgi:tRNA(adenine34) deaminase|nr:nucleoside deaminase [Sphingobacteriales bacterium]
MFTDEYFMRLALQQANLAFTANEVPIGAIVVCNNTIVAKAYNQTELLQDVTAHAEILAITAAANYLGSKYLPNCALYVTVEPCLMCSGASYWAQLGKVVYGAADEKRGFTTLQKPVFHPKTQVVGGILATECAALMSDFFKQKR